MSDDALMKTLNEVMSEDYDEIYQPLEDATFLIENFAPKKFGEWLENFEARNPNVADQFTDSEEVLLLLAQAVLGLPEDNMQVYRKFIRNEWKELSDEIDRIQRGEEPTVLPPPLQPTQKFDPMKQYMPVDQEFFQAFMATARDMRNALRAAHAALPLSLRTLMLTTNEAQHVLGDHCFFAQQKALALSSAYDDLRSQLHQRTKTSVPQGRWMTTKAPELPPSLQRARQSAATQLGVQPQSLWLDESTKEWQPKTQRWQEPISYRFKQTKGERVYSHEVLSEPILVAFPPNKTLDMLRAVYQSRGIPRSLLNPIVDVIPPLALGYGPSPSFAKEIIDTFRFLLNALSSCITYFEHLATAHKEEQMRTIRTAVDKKYLNIALDVADHILDTARQGNINAVDFEIPREDILQLLDALERIKSHSQRKQIVEALDVIITLFHRNAKTFEEFQETEPLLRRALIQRHYTMADKNNLALKTITLSAIADGMVDFVRFLVEHVLPDGGRYMKKSIATYLREAIHNDFVDVPTLRTLTQIIISTWDSQSIRSAQYEFAREQHQNQSISYRYKAVLQELEAAMVQD
jgi:hypothetical protein